MAIQRFNNKGTPHNYSVIECNAIGATHNNTGVIAQMDLNPNQFSASKVCENGMVLEIDRVSNRLNLPTAGGDDGKLYGIVYDVEVIRPNFNTKWRELKEYHIYPDPDTHYGFMPYGSRPRLFSLNQLAGDEWTTDGFTYETADFADTEEVIDFLEDIADDPTVNQAWAQIGADGFFQIVTTAPANGPVVRIVFSEQAQNSLPNGDPAATFYRDRS